MADSDAIVTLLGLDAYFGKSKLTLQKVVVEVLSNESRNLLSPGGRFLEYRKRIFGGLQDNVHAIDHIQHTSPAYASGTIIDNSILTVIMSATYYNPYAYKLLKQLLKIDEKPYLNIVNIDEEFFDSMKREVKK